MDKKPIIKKIIFLCSGGTPEHHKNRTAIVLTVPFDKKLDDANDTISVLMSDGKLPKTALDFDYFLREDGETLWISDNT